MIHECYYELKWDLHIMFTVIKKSKVLLIEKHFLKFPIPE